MKSIHYYMVVRFIVSLFIFTFIVHPSSSNMATGNNNLSSDITMESLASEIRNLKAELTALQAQEGFQNLSLNERRREHYPQHHPSQASRPNNIKIQYFANQTGWAASLATRKNQVKFAEAHQTLPDVTSHQGSYGCNRVAAIEEEEDPMDALEC